MKGVGRKWCTNDLDTEVIFFQRGSTGRWNRKELEFGNGPLSVGSGMIILN